MYFMDHNPMIGIIYGKRWRTASFISRKEGKRAEGPEAESPALYAKNPNFYYICGQTQNTH